MKKIFLGIMIGLMTMVLVSVAMAFTTASAQESAATATVGVNEVISFTVVDFGGSGVGFGDFNPGTVDNAANPNPALNLTVGKTTNIDVNISLKGIDWAGPAALTLVDSDVKYDDDAAPNEGVGDTGQSEGVLTTTFADWYTEVAPLGGNEPSTEVFHFISIPSGQRAGNYVSTFTYRASR